MKKTMKEAFLAFWNYQGGWKIQTISWIIIACAWDIYDAVFNHGTVNGFSLGVMVYMLIFFWKLTKSFLDKSYTGKHIEYYSDGQKQLEQNYKNGKLEGLETTWYESGKKKSEKFFKNDKLEGLSIVWHENGQKEVERNYKNGKEDGVFTTWHENGKVRSKRSYKNGVKQQHQLTLRVLIRNT